MNPLAWIVIGIAWSLVGFLGLLNYLKYAINTGGIVNEDVDLPPLWLMLWSVAWGPLTLILSIFQVRGWKYDDRL